MIRSLRLALKTTVTLLVIVIVGVSLLIWRLSSSPVTSAFLTPYIERGIDRYIPDTHTTIDHTLLTWNNVDQSVALHADGVRVSDESGAIIAEVPNLDIQLSVVGLLFGQFLPTALTVEHPQFKLERDSEGVLRFGGMTSASKGNADIKGSLAHVARNLAHAFVTHKLKINHIVLDVHDENSQSDWAVSIPEVSLESVGGHLTGHAAVDVTQKDQTSTLAVNYDYDRHEDLHVLDTRITDITPAAFAGGHPGTLGLGIASVFDLPLTGKVLVAFDSRLSIAEASLEIHGDEGRLVYPDFWDKPRDVKSMDIKAAYDRPNRKFEISSATIDFGGPKLGLAVKGRDPLLARHDLDFDLSVQFDNWPMDQYADLWPKPVMPNAREWIAASLSKGKFTHGEAVFEGALSWNDLGDMEITKGKGKVSASGARGDYLEGMPPLEGVNADATFDLTQMAVQISGGGTGDLRLSPFTIQMTELDKDVQNIDIPLKLSGPISDVLRLIDVPRLGYAKAVGLSPDDVSGQLEGTVELRFPMLKTLLMKDVDVKANANLANMASSRLVKGIGITQGNLVLGLDKQGFVLKGLAALNRVPFQISWQQNFDENNKPLRKATVTGTISDDQWNLLGIAALKGTRGPVPVSVDLIQQDKEKTLVSGKLDLTAAEIHVDQLNWKKPSNAAALLKFAAEMPEGKDISVTSVDLSGSQIDIKGNAVITGDGQLLSLNLNPMVIGRTNAALHFSQSGDDKHTLRFEAQGNSLDVSGLKGDKEPAHTDPRPKEYHIKIGKLYTSDTGFIANVSGYAIRDPLGWNQIGLHGQADGNHQLDVDLVSKEDGHRVFAITCDDFGKALKGMGFTDTVSGGKVEIRGASTVDNPRVIEGDAKIGQFTVRNLPVLAVLLNATSPFGFAGLLTNSADFDRLTGKFRWEGDGIELIDIRVAGTSVGMNIEGKVDMNSGASNLRGTLVPFSMVNRVLGSIPLIGDILTGGNGGGVLAVAYTITGDLSNPNVSVNPVSLLTPGFLRNIFFGGDDSDDTASDNPKPEPQPAATTNFNQ